jgi:predicted ATPase/DNA-binding SARP family transcriptional activator
LILERLSLYLFGPPRIELDSKPVEIDRNKASALLAYLAVTQTGHSRDALAALFWPDYDQSSAYAYLRRTLWTLNKTLGGGWIAARRNTISLELHPNIWVDVNRFIEIYANCIETKPSDNLKECTAELNEAADLYKNDFLAGFTLRDSPDFDDWQVIQTQELRRMLGSILERLTLTLLAAKHLEQAQFHAQRWLSLDEYNEDGQRALMQIYQSMGKRNAALKIYQDFRRLLKSELKIEPQQETRALYLQIKNNDYPEGHDDTHLEGDDTHLEGPVPVQQEDEHGKIPPIVHLPKLAASFIGRERELEDITTKLQIEECRLVTLLGPGGVGKTRLALQAASSNANLVDQEGRFVFHHGVYFVSLAPLKSSKQLIPTIADALNITFQTEIRSEIPRQEPLVQLIDYLRDKRVLLIMDNFEHLVDGADLISEILAEAPGVKILTTSRVRMNLYEEWSLEISGLSFPEIKSLAPILDMGAIDRYSAVELFIKNAQRVHSSFTPDEDDWLHIIKICEMVDGLPLGIELASSWVRVLSLSEIVSEVSRSLDFLTTSLRNVPERHRSMRAVFDQSWSMLTVQEQQVLKRLSLIRGSFDREAGIRIAETSIVILSSLIDKTLIHTHSDMPGNTRYHMHDLVKQYAYEKLEDSLEELEQGRDLHARYFGDLIKEMGILVQGRDQQTALNHIEEALEDGRAAWRWSLDRGFHSTLLDMAGPLIIFHDIRGRLLDIQDLIVLSVENLSEKINTLSEDAVAFCAFCLSISIRINEWMHVHRDVESINECLKLLSRVKNPVLTRSAYTSLFFGAGVLSAEESFEIYQSIMESYNGESNQWGLGLTQLAFSDYLFSLEENEELAWHLKREAWRRFEEIGNQWGIALSSGSMANQAYQIGDYIKAREYGFRSASIYKELGDKWRTINSLITIGQACTALGEYSQARLHFSESMELAKYLGNRNSIAVHLDCLGYVDLLDGNLVRAQQYYRDSLRIYRSITEYHGLGMANMNLGDIARLSGNVEEAEKCYHEGLHYLHKLAGNDSWTEWGLMLIYRKLGYVALQQGNDELAHQYYLSGLHKAWESSRTAEILENLIGIAELDARSGNMEKAVTLLAHAIGNPSTPKETALRAENLLAHYENTVPADDFSNFVKSGRNSQLQELCRDMLPE